MRSPLAWYSRGGTLAAGRGGRVTAPRSCSHTRSCLSCRSEWGRRKRRRARCSRSARSPRRCRSPATGRAPWPRDTRGESGTSTRARADGGSQLVDSPGRDEMRFRLSSLLNGQDLRRQSCGWPIFKNHAAFHLLEQSGKCPDCELPSNVFFIWAAYINACTPFTLAARHRLRLDPVLRSMRRTYHHPDLVGLRVDPTLYEMPSRH
jgi:hypothetical protein